MSETKLNRRIFLQTLGTAAAAAGVPRAMLGQASAAVAIVTSPSDAVASSQPARWAADFLEQSLKDRGIVVHRAAHLGAASHIRLWIVAAGARNITARRILHRARVTVAASPEALGIVATRRPGRRILLACGHDARGLVYALTELADLVQNSADPLAALAAVKTITEKPANQVRSMNRLFCSDVEDKPWYNDREMWPRYFDMLASRRFNRFSLAFGIGYDFLRNVTDAYFLFPYPFLLNVPGYNVRVPQLPDEERDHNLEMLRYISEQCTMRGMEFHLGLWMHGYEWIDSPNPNYTIEGLDAKTHAPYCRDAVRLLLQRVPKIHGLTFRIHGESGVPEGHFGFWKTVFDGVATCGRTVPIDMHPKGMSRQMIEVGLGTGQPISMSPKFWAEHMGMAYHQADIRLREKPKAKNVGGLLSLSSGTRNFLRYGYGDLLTEDRKWTVVHRIWPGTQRLLLWGDPTFAAAYSRAFQFCGSNGVEIMEPLSFKGRRGTGIAGSRCAYADHSLDPRWDWQKYEYSARIWGRLLYNPETQPAVWRRSLQRQFGAGAVAMENALASVSRILPVVTTAYAPSAANNLYWPEMYFNQSLKKDENREPFRDAEPPYDFGHASSFDPELFLSIDECADLLLKDQDSPKYSPIEVAHWLNEFVAGGRNALEQAQAVAGHRHGAAFRRAQIDIELQAGLGDFFAAKFRSGVLYRLFQATQEQAALQAAIAQYKQARAAWAQLAHTAWGVYVPDVTVGEQPWLRGHWVDRLAGIDNDIDALSAMLDPSEPDAPSPPVARAMQAVFDAPNRDRMNVRHIPPRRFTRGRALALRLRANTEISSARLCYRHVDQAESYESVAMRRVGSGFLAIIPAAYTETEFPLEYFFELTDRQGIRGLHPGFNPALASQPYYAVQGA